MSEVRCPRCGSNQLTANKTGFSGAKAVGGAILTGGIGLLAGTIGSNKVKITCLACGKTFRPGEGNVVKTQDESTSSRFVSSDVTKEKNRIVCSTCRTENFPNHLYCRNCGKELNTEDERIYSAIKPELYACPSCKKLTPKDAKFCPNCKTPLKPKTGCFVATACYGNYDAPEVLILRQFRDEKLLKSFIGKVFVRFYYSVSPFFATLISKSNSLKQAVRQYILEPLIKKLQRANKRE